MEGFRPEHGLGCKVARNVFTRSANRAITYPGDEGMVYPGGDISSAGAANGYSCLPVLSIA